MGFSPPIRPTFDMTFKGNPSKKGGRGTSNYLSRLCHFVWVSFLFFFCSAVEIQKPRSPQSNETLLYDRKTLALTPSKMAEVRKCLQLFRSQTK